VSVSRESFQREKNGWSLRQCKTTVQSLDVARIDLEDNLILIKGAIPGSIGSFVKITPSIKGGHSFTVPAPVAEEAAAPVDAPVKEAAAPVEEAAAPVEEAPASVEEAKEEAPAEEIAEENKEEDK
jgi:large subunit ribosomal protein L3